MKYFIDTEFLEGPQERPLMLKGRLGNMMFGYPKPTIDLISIGIVAEDGREYYAISKDFNLKEAWNRFDEKVETMSGDMRNHFPESRKYKYHWIRENVLFPIWKELFHKDGWKTATTSEQFTYNSFKHLINKYGKTNKEIAEEIKEFCKSEVFHNLYNTTTRHGTKIIRGLPEFYAYYADYDWVAFCWLFGKMIDLPKGFPMYCKDLKQMLDVAEDKFPLSNGLKGQINYPKQTNKHNALTDARWNKKLYDFLTTL